MTKQELYNEKALRYAEEHGIITYRVKGNRLIYNQNYKNTQFINGKWRDNPCTYQRVINLDNGQESSRRLSRIQKDGWNNV
jgi:ribosomal protein L16 Arg81 hydroxylase